MDGRNVDASIYQCYLIDLGVLMTELALEAKAEAVEKDTDFSIGYLAGFHRVISLMQQQAEAFNISLSEIGLDRVDANKDLI